MIKISTPIFYLYLLKFRMRKNEGGKMENIRQMVEKVAMDTWNKIENLSLEERAEKLIKINNNLNNGIKLYFSEVWVDDEDQVIRPLFELDGKFKMTERDFWSGYDKYYLISASYFKGTKKVYNEIFDEYDEIAEYESEVVDYYSCKQWRMLEKLANFTKIIKEKTASVANTSNTVPIRWLGAYQTGADGEIFEFEESLEWETSVKNREVAAQLFCDMDEVGKRFYNFQTYLDSKQLGIMYDNKDITAAYNCDVFSMNLGPILVPQRDYEDMYETEKSKEHKGHSEAFIAVNAIPKAIIIRGKLKEELMELVNNISKKKGIKVLHV